MVGVAQKAGGAGAVGAAGAQVRFGDDLLRLRGAEPGQIDLRAARVFEILEQDGVPARAEREAAGVEDGAVVDEVIDDDGAVDGQALAVRAGAAPCAFARTNRSR